MKSARNKISCSSEMGLHKLNRDGYSTHTENVRMSCLFVTGIAQIKNVCGTSFKDIHHGHVQVLFNKESFCL